MVVEGDLMTEPGQDLRELEAAAVGLGMVEQDQISMFG